MLFSVIIPTFNRRELLQAALESVWRQTCTDYEIIVVDDGSTDDTVAWLRTLGDRISVFSQPNLGPGSSRNLGASQARGDYLAFLDSDDLWFPWSLATFARAIAQFKQPAILSANLVHFVDESELAGITETPMQASWFGDFFASHEAGCFVGAGMSVMLRSAFVASGGYTPKPITFEDHDLILRMGDAPGFVQLEAPITLGWRRHAGSMSADLKRSVVGAQHLVQQERTNAYPGGTSRERQRRAIIGRHVRPIAVACARQGMTEDAWRFYRETFAWHVRLGRWRFLTGFPVQALIHRSAAARTDTQAHGNAVT